MIVMLEPLVENIEKLEKQVQLILFIPEELLYFRGHFPEYPVLPGVVQTHWAIIYGTKHLGLPQRIKKLKAIKFKKLIQPKARLNLTLNLNDKYELIFNYKQQGMMMSSGKIVYLEGT